MAMSPQSGYPHPEYPQQPAGQPPSGGPSGGKVAAIVGSLVVVVALIAVGITGFVAPGFFLSDDDERASDDSSEGASLPGAGDGAAGDVDSPTTTGVGGAPEPPSPEATTWMQAFIDRVNAHDADGAWELACDDAQDDEDMAQALETMELYTPVELIGELTGGAGPDHGSHDVRITIEGDTYDNGSIAAEKQDGSWCIRKFGPG